MPDPTKDQLLDQAEELGLDRDALDREKKDVIADAVDAERARRGIENVQTVPQADAPAARPAEPVPVDQRSTPASPDNPTDGRPPLAQVAQDAAANTYVRVIGAKEDE